jgi:hypothetical protein
VLTGAANRAWSRRARLSLSALVIVLGAVSWAALRASPAIADTACTVNASTASILLNQSAGTPTSLTQDGSGNLLVDGSVCGGFAALSEIQLSVAIGAPAQTLMLDQTGPGGVFPCGVPLEGSLGSNGTIEVRGADGESISAGDTSGGSGVDLNSCGSVGTITGVSSYDLTAGAGAVTLSAGGGSGFAGPLSVPATLRPASASPDTLIGGTTQDSIDFSGVATSGSAPLAINVSGGPSGSLANDTASVGSVTDSFASGAAEFTTFVGASSGHTDFLAGSSAKTFSNPAGASGDEIDFSAVPTSSSMPLTVNLSGASSRGVASDTAVAGNVTDNLITGGAPLTLLAAQSGYTTFLPGSTSENFDGTGAAATNTLDFANVPTSTNAGLIVNRSGGQHAGIANNTATVGATTYDFSNLSVSNFDASADGNTRFLAGVGSDSFSAPAGTAAETDTLDFSQAPGTSLAINASGATSGGVANDTAQLNSATDTFSPNITTFDGLATGNTTFLAAASGGLAFVGLSTGNTLGLQAVPAEATVTANSDSAANPGQVQTLAAGVGGSTTDTFAGIQSYVDAPNATTSVVDDYATGNPWSGTEESGASADDTATVSAIDNVAPTGIVTYELFANGACSGTATTDQQVTLSAGNVPTSRPTGPLAAGDYGFQAKYSGDASYRPSTGSCERFVISAPSAPPPTTTAPTITSPPAPTAPPSTTTTPATTAPTTTTTLPTATAPTTPPVTPIRLRITGISVTSTTIVWCERAGCRYPTTRACALRSTARPVSGCCYARAFTVTGSKSRPPRYEDIAARTFTGSPGAGTATCFPPGRCRSWCRPNETITGRPPRRSV